MVPAGPGGKPLAYACRRAGASVPRTAGLAHDDLMISFSVPGGGVGPHIDQYDVFIIQGMGSRRWRVGDKLPMRQFCPHPALLHVDPFPPIIDEDLQPATSSIFHRDSRTTA